jgi:hypothetical protein
MFLKNILKFTTSVVKNLIEDEEFVDLVSDVISDVIVIDKDKDDINITSDLFKLEKENDKILDKVYDKSNIINNISENGLIYYQPYVSNIILDEKKTALINNNFSILINLFKKNKKLGIDYELLQKFIDLIKSVLLNKTTIILTEDSLRFLLNAFLNIIKNINDMKCKVNVVEKNSTETLSFLNNVSQLEYKVKQEEKQIVSTIIPKAQSIESKIKIFIDNKLIEKFNVYFAFYSFIVNILFLNFSKFHTKKNKQLEIVKNILQIQENKCDKITNFKLNTTCRDEYESKIITEIIQLFIELITTSKKLDLRINYRVLYDVLQIMIDLLKINKDKFSYEYEFIKWLLSMAVQILHIYGIIQVKYKPYSHCYIK